MTLGDFDAGAVVFGKFTTYRPTTGVPFTLAGTPALSVYKDDSLTQSTAGVTLTADFDAVTGLNHFAIDLSADGTFYAAGSFFDVVITTGTVDSVSAVGAVVGRFTIRKTAALKPTTAGRSLTVEADGMAHADVKEWKGTVPANLTDTDKVQASVAHYTVGTAQTGDSFARLGANGAGLTSLASQTSVDDIPTNAEFALRTLAAADYATAANQTTLLDRLTAARAGYLDNLNVGGVVASQADITALNQSASRRIILTTVQQYERPESGSSTYTVESRTYDGDGAAVNADSTPTLTATGIVSGDLSANLSVASNPATGVYRWTYTVGTAHAIEQVRFDVSATLSAAAFTLSAYSQVVDFVAAEWTSTDQSNLTAIFNKLPSKAFLTGTANSDGDIEAGDMTGNFPGSVGSIAGVTFPTNFASFAITAAGGVTLADGVTHGGTTAMFHLGSSDATIPFQVLSAGGHAVNFESTGSNGAGFRTKGFGSGAGHHAIGGASFGSGVRYQNGTGGFGALINGGLNSSGTNTLDITGSLSGSIGSLAAQAQTDVRTAVGLGAANLDTQLGDLPTNAELATALDALPTANENADAVLSRGVSNVQDTADPHSLCTIVLAALESSRSGTTWTINKTGGTLYLAKTIATDGAAELVTGVT